LVSPSLLAIRLGVPQDSRLVARKLEDAALGVYASASYLKQRGVPQTLNDLPRHDCIQFIMPSTGKTLPWSFHGPDGDIEYSFASSIRFSGDVLGCVGYAHAGGGIFQTYDFIVAGNRYPDLVEILTPYRGRARPFSVLYPQNRHLSTRVRAFVDCLTSELSALSRTLAQTPQPQTLSARSKRL
jgi:DNA-binding transcriptional LysR family regulator